MEYPYKKICDGIYEISEFYQASMYLVEGEKKALLIDTGVGVGNLREFAQGLTEKPLDVFITHNHRDHIGNAGLFDHIYISDIDSKTGPLIYPVSVRMQYANNMRRMSPAGGLWEETDFPVFTETDIPAVTRMQDGDVIDLGGRTLRGFLCPGHSPGSMVLIDSRTGFLFCGDICGTNVGLGVRNFPNLIHPSMEDTLSAMRRLWAMDFDHNRIYNGHAVPRLRPLGEPVPGSTFEQLTELMELIIDGRCSVEKFYILNVHTTVEKAEYQDVSIEFHENQVHGKNTVRFLCDTPAVCTY